MTGTYEIIKSREAGYILIVQSEEIGTNDYRFRTKAELKRWLKAAGLA